MNTRSSSKKTEGGVISSTGVDGTFRVTRERLLLTSLDAETIEVIEVLVVPRRATTLEGFLAAEGWLSDCCAATYARSFGAVNERNRPAAERP
jgi:hypothetical protein